MILSAGLVIVILTMVIIDPGHRSVSAGYFSNAGKFWRGETVYRPEASAGFLYLPGFLAAYLPLRAMGLPLGDLAWRAINIGLIAYALYRAALRIRVTRDTMELVGLAALISLVGAAGAIRNGQSTTLLLAATFLAFDALYDRTYWKAAAWATVAVVAKPLGIVVWLLVGGTALAAMPWLLLFLGLALALPYAAADPAYANDLYAEFIAVLRNIAPEQERPAWTDFMAILRALGVPLGQEAALGIRAVAAVATFVAVWLLRRSPDYLRAALLPATLAASYMLLFNPRAETNTYIMMAIPFGLLAAYLLRETGEAMLGRVLVIACVALGTGALGKPVMGIFDPWSKPLLLIVALIASAVALSRHYRQRTSPTTGRAGYPEEAQQSSTG